MIVLFLLQLGGTEVHSMMGDALERKMGLKSIPFLSSSGFFKVDSNGDAIQDFFTAKVSIPDLQVGMLTDAEHFGSISI